MTPEQKAKMQAGRFAAALAKKAEAERATAEEDAAWKELHEQALADHRRRWEEKLVNEALAECSTNEVKRQEGCVK